MLSVERLMPSSRKETSANSSKASSNSRAKLASKKASKQAGKMTAVQEQKVKKRRCSALKQSRVETEKVTKSLNRKMSIAVVHYRGGFGDRFDRVPEIIPDVF